MILLEGNRNLSKNTSLNMSFQMINIVYGHVFDVVIKSQEGIHLSSEFWSLGYFLEPFLKIFLWEEYFPSEYFPVVSFLVFNPKSLEVINSFFILLILHVGGYLLVFYLLFSILINKNHIFKSFGIYIIVLGCHCLLLF